jgi:hypothetical protein
MNEMAEMSLAGAVSIDVEQTVEPAAHARPIVELAQLSGSELLAHELASLGWAIEHEPHSGSQLVAVRGSRRLRCEAVTTTRKDGWIGRDVVDQHCKTSDLVALIVSPRTELSTFGFVSFPVFAVSAERLASDVQSASRSGLLPLLPVNAFDYPTLEFWLRNGDFQFVR